jgi:hypothetical protein
MSRAFAHGETSHHPFTSKKKRDRRTDRARKVPARGGRCGPDPASTASRRESSCQRVSRAVQWAATRQELRFQTDVVPGHERTRVPSRRKDLKEDGNP